MSDIAIRAEALGKKYTISHGAAREPYTALRDIIARRSSSALRQVGHLFHGRSLVAGEVREEVWALRDLNFEVRRGEVLGVIGANGAGKSTLLKILARVTAPTEGRVTISGRLASLLEVGTGFHPELTGRENVFLNGAILGMRRAEVLQKFDEIVDFADIARFIDTPVKRYSTGMYTRLAFAVAAHMEPDILIVDEVLAVGDLAFQKKCVGRMRQASQAEGRAVLFVSHNMQAIRELCSTAMLMNGGQLVSLGDVRAVLEAYRQCAGVSAVPPPRQSSSGADARCRVIGLRLETMNGEALMAIGVGRPWRARIRVRVERPLEGLVVALGLVSTEGVTVQNAWAEPLSCRQGEYEFTFVQDRVVLAAGSYDVYVGVTLDERTLQQGCFGCIHITADDAAGYFQGTADRGVVLNSMRISVRAEG